MVRHTFGPAEHYAYTSTPRVDVGALAFAPSTTRLPEESVASNYQDISYFFSKTGGNGTVVLLPSFHTHLREKCAKRIMISVA